jgi:mevalonate kinase
LGIAALLATAPLSIGCVDSTALDKTTNELDQIRRSEAQKDQQIQALQWQVGALGQRFQAAATQVESERRETDKKLADLAAENHDLAEKLRMKQDEAVRLAAAVRDAEDLASQKPGAGGGGARLRPEDVRRIEAAVAARDAELSKTLARIERLLAQRSGGSDRAQERPARTIGSDLTDPWGDRK